jgi:Nickel responsive protein SCO4226-like
MENVVAERVFDDPVMADRLHAIVEQARWCLEQNRTSAVRTYLSLDGRKMACLFEAPDTEAVRRVSQQVQMPAVRVWNASILAPAAAAGDGARAVVVVERSFAEPVAFEELAAREEAGAWCLDVHRVRFLRSYFSSDRRRLMCIYEAPDAESVRRAQERIGMPVDEVWPATVEWHR